MSLFGQNNNQQQSSGFGGFGSNNNNTPSGMSSLRSKFYQATFNSIDSSIPPFELQKKVPILTTDLGFGQSTPNQGGGFGSGASGGATGFSGFGSGQSHP